MKKIFALLLCLALLGAWVLPVAAAESVETEEALPASGNGTHVMAVVCLVILVAGGTYLFFQFKRKK